MSPTRAPKDPGVKAINLALQGGGSHGAYTWGVLDALLEDGRVRFEGVTATSAGSMNAVIMMDGIMKGGADGARQGLENFWRRVSQNGMFFDPSPEAFQSFNPFRAMIRSGENAFSQGVMGNLTRSFSPYQFNPLNINPLRDILQDMVDFDAVRRCKKGKLFIAATHVEKGTSRIFRNEDITIDVLMASAALPQLFHAVEIDGDHYWDGGYMGNPALWPLFYQAECRDILIVHVNPLVRSAVPKDVDAIENRLNEITFNGAMLKELRAIAFVQKLLEDDMLKDEYKSKYKNILLHAIRSEKVMSDLPLASKYSVAWDFLTDLRDKGRLAAKHWLRYYLDDVGVRSTVDIQRDYLNIDRRTGDYASS